MRAHTPAAPYNPSNATQDLYTLGSNAWLFHTPDDGRHALYVVPWVAGDWDWSVQTEFRDNGDLRLPRNLHVLNRVGIGTDPATMGALRLAVEGTIGARAVKVTAVGTAWPDYVFRPGYRLRPLREVGAYAARYHHLPEVPSAAAVQRQGLDLVATDALLLRKSRRADAVPGGAGAPPRGPAAPAAQAGAAADDETQLGA